MPVKSQLINLIEQANQLKASDIHFKLTGELITIQFRVGAFMMTHEQLSLTAYNQLLSYIKFQSALTLVHPRQPQSGLLTLETIGKTYYCRVSLLPTYHYQSLVLRLINHQVKRSLDSIPHFAQEAQMLKDMAGTQAGLLLISGPTGSGKTTTLYAFIDYLKHELEKSIITIEDPVEFQKTDIVQMQVNEQLGLTYDVAIRETLRHDPDVIVIGEIRDVATAQSALRAALTGHLVISTIHSKNVMGTLYRLLDLGLSAQDLEQALMGVINQQLIGVEGDYKALFEICFGEQLDNLFLQIGRGTIGDLSYKALEEGGLKWKTMPTAS